MKFLATATFLTIASAFSAFAQSDRLTVIPKKMTYKRTGPKVPDFKKTFEARTPLIKSKLTPAVRKNIERQIDYWRLFNMSLRDNLRDDHWLSSFDYEVKYNKNYIFDVWLTMEGVGAYPDSASKYLVLDIRTGKLLSLGDLFTTSALPKLTARIRDAMRRELAANPEAKTEYEQHINIYGEKHKPSVDRLELKHLSGFSVTDRGMIFIYDYGFPHVIKAVQPEGNYFFTWAELKPFIKGGGLLSAIAR